MKRFFVPYLVSLLVFLCLDALWLGVLMGPTYRGWIGPLMRDTPVLWAVLGFYLLYVLGLQFFAVAPALRSASARHALIASGLLGLVAYGTYDLSNMATLNAWSTPLTLVDMAWGMVVSALSGLSGYVVARRLG